MTARVNYSSLEAFYDEKPARRRSAEADYGVHWRSTSEWGTSRLSYIRDTGEVYAVKFSPARVEVLGIVPPDDEEIFYRTLDRILKGWLDQCGEPNGLQWVRERLKEA